MTRAKRKPIARPPVFGMPPKQVGKKDDEPVPKADAGQGEGGTDGATPPANAGPETLAPETLAPEIGRRTRDAGEAVHVVFICSTEILLVAAVVRRRWWRLVHVNRNCVAWYQACVIYYSSRLA